MSTQDPQLDSVLSRSYALASSRTRVRHRAAGARRRAHPFHFGEKKARTAVHADWRLRALTVLHDEGAALGQVHYPPSTPGHPTIPQRSQNRRAKEPGGGDPSCWPPTKSWACRCMNRTPGGVCRGRRIRPSIGGHHVQGTPGGCRRHFLPVPEAVQSHPQLIERSTGPWALWRQLLRRAHPRRSPTDRSSTSPGCALPHGAVHLFPLMRRTGQFERT